MKKLGPVVRGTLYIQLANFPKNYLVLVVGDDDFRYALITVELLAGTMYTELAMKDVAWVMVDRMHGEIDVTPVAGPEEGMAMALGRKRPGQDANADASQELHQSTRYVDIATIWEACVKSVQLQPRDTSPSRTVFVLLVGEV